MRAYTARFEQLTHSLGLRHSSNLVPQSIASIPELLATHLQLHAVSNPELTLSDVIRVAISLESCTTIAINSNSAPTNSYIGG